MRMETHNRTARGEKAKCLFCWRIPPQARSRGGATRIYRCPRISTIDVCLRGYPAGSCYWALPLFRGDFSSWNMFWLVISFSMNLNF